jgi:hypothetical protein
MNFAQCPECYAVLHGGPLQECMKCGWLSPERQYQADLLNTLREIRDELKTINYTLKPNKARCQGEGLGI